MLNNLIERDVSHLSDAQRMLLAKRLKGRELVQDVPPNPAPTVLINDAARWFDPYPLRGFQHDQQSHLEAGADGCHLYLETRRATLDTARFRHAWLRLYGHYEVMRSRIVDGKHKVLPPDTAYDIVVEDLRNLPPNDRLARLQDRRAWFHALDGEHGGHAVQVAVCQMDDDDYRCFFSFSLLVMDTPSIEFLALRCRLIYEDRFDDDPRPCLSIRDYRLTEDAYLASDDGAAARSYWERKCARQSKRIRSSDLGGPRHGEHRGRHGYLCETLNVEQWARFKDLAKDHQVSEFVAIHTLFMDLLARQSGTADFGMEARTFQRLPMHSHILELLGPFTLGHVVQRESSAQASFAERCVATQLQVDRDLLHAYFDAATQWHAVEPSCDRGQKIVFTNTCVHFKEFVRSNSRVPPLRWLGDVQSVWQAQPGTALEYVLVDNDLALENHWFVNPDLVPMSLSVALHQRLMEALRALSGNPELWEATCVFLSLEERQTPQAAL
jgi:hypothetical protein